MIQILIDVIESVDWQTLGIKINIKILFCQMPNELVHRD